MTVTEKTSDTTLETSIIEDDILGREKLLKKLYIQCICVKISSVRYVTN